MSESPISEARLRAILERQLHPGWGAEYIPSIRATREEAPSISRPSTIRWPKFGRKIHLLSSVENSVALLALYHPWLFEFQEQRMLSCKPCAHPISGHPKAVGKDLPSLRGTVDVADSLGVLHFHPLLRRGRGLDPVPFPLIGDFLLFLEDEQGAYCVNWTIKANHADFDTSPHRSVKTRNTPLAAEQEKARHRVEAVYYQDGRIRTQRIALGDLDWNVVCNLRQLVLWQGREATLTPEEKQRILDHFNAGLAATVPPMEVIHSLARSSRHSVYDLKIVLHQAIWNRELNIDLTRPFEINKPFKPMRIDILQMYGHLFARGSQ